MNEHLLNLWGVAIRQGEWEVQVRNGVEVDILSNGWVPTNHDFNTVISDYLLYREIRQNDETFRQWLIRNDLPPSRAVSALSFLNLAEKPVSFIIALSSPVNSDIYAIQSLLFLNRYREHVITHNQWDLFPDYLMDTYLVGMLNNLNIPLETLTELRYAGNNNAPSALKAVGVSFGRHFRFLNTNNQPTLLFEKFFLTTDPIEYWISDVIPVGREV